MPHPKYRYAIDLYKEDQTPLGRVPVDVDWEPVFEWLGLLGIRRGRFPPVTPRGRGVVEPLWHPNVGPPYVSGFRASVSRGDRTQVSCDLPISYLNHFAQQVGATPVEDGKLEPGECSRFLVVALACDQAPDEAPPRFSVEQVVRPLPLGTKTVGALASQAVPAGTTDAEDIPVFIPRTVLDQAAELTRKAGSNETGGILIGHLHRDPSVREIAAEITAQIPARHTESALTRLTFTAETWADVDAAVRLRRRDEIYLGWWHSHSYLKEVCERCEHRAEGTCNVTAAFMSTDDCALHRAVFPCAYAVALVVSDSPCSGLTQSLFGWRRGLIVRRGFHVLDAGGARASASTTGGHSHASV